MEIRNLENIDFEQIRETFNLAFSDYIVPFQLSQEQFETKLKGESLSLQDSVGVFDGDQLVAFILHCCRPNSPYKTVYNSGTGVIPSHRGQGLTKAMYQYILPKLQDRGFDHVQLEVIEKNTPAIKSYTAVGFEQTRELRCYKGCFGIEPNDTEGIHYKPLETYNWEIMKSFWSLSPTWQSDIAVTDNIKSNTIGIGAYDGEQLVGYVIYVPNVKKILQIAVKEDYRRKGIGKRLLYTVLTHQDKNFLVVNIDAGNTETNRFLTHIGMENHINQFELVCKLKAAH